MKLKKLFIGVFFMAFTGGLCLSKEHVAPKLPKDVKVFKCAPETNSSRIILIFEDKYMVYKDLSSGLEINGLISQRNDTLKMKAEYIIGKHGDGVWIDNHLYDMPSGGKGTTDKSNKNSVYTIKSKSENILLPPIDGIQSKNKMFLIKNKYLIELLEVNSSLGTTIIKVKYDLIFQK